MIGKPQITAEPIADALVNKGSTMSEDPRCCGTGTCIINNQGVCWCGQVWDGEKMCMSRSLEAKDEDRDETQKITDPVTGS
jgi:hypothetical protein